MPRGDTSRRMHRLPSSGGGGRFRGIWMFQNTGKFSDARCRWPALRGLADVLFHHGTCILPADEGGSRASTCARGHGWTGNRPCPEDNV